MKKPVVGILCTVLCLSMAACGNQNGANMENAAQVAEDFAEKETGEDSVKQQGENMTELEAEGPKEEGQNRTDENEHQNESAEPTEAQVLEIPFSTDFYDYESMADLLSEYGILFGTCMNADNAQDYTLQALVGQHFNSITATNEMKAYCLLDAQASRKSKDGMPVMDFDGAAGIIEAAAMNGAKVRGHVLVWDAHMSDWFFREGYKSNGAYVDRETMLKRMESYITQVITYFEETYPGVVYCWDVVNEAVGDNSTDYAEGDDRHIRTYRSGKDNLFYKYVGEDYVELSFLYARNAVEALQAKNPEVDIKLFYNDYNAFYEEKRDAICNLVESINSFALDADGNPKKLCDGVGMQGYIGGYGKQSGCMNKSNISMIKKAVEKYADLGVEVQLTEMSVRNYSKAEADIQKHADYYEELMRTLVEINSGDEKPITCIAVWGLTDMAYIDESSYSYKMGGPYSGLFTPGYEVKDAFHQVYIMLKEKQQ